MSEVIGLSSCNPCCGDEDGTRSAFQEHGKELATALAVLFAILAGLGLIFCVDPKDLVEARNWAGQSWKEYFCTVEDFGISYRGTCETDVTITMTDYKDYAECLGPRHADLSPQQVRDDWQFTPAGRCARRGNEAYAASGSGQVLTRRLAAYRHERLVCHNSYLTWAVLRIENGSHSRPISRCAYEFGAVIPSIIGDWDAAKRDLKRMRQAKGVPGGFVCWILEADDCVVAFRNQKRYTRQERGERDLIRVHTVICGALALLFGAFAAWWQCQDVILLPSPRGRHMALPTSEPPQGPLLSERVQRVMSIAAQRLTDTTPPVSGDSTLRISGVERSHRTIEVVLPNGNQATVSQNIASDFIEIGR